MYANNFISLFLFDTFFTDALHDVEIRVAINVDQLDSEYNYCAHSEAPFSTGSSRLLTCENVKVGRYVRLQITDSDTAEYLEVAEVRVLGF